jgi:predicted DNA-binding transcriptional regulator YafY
MEQRVSILYLEEDGVERMLDVRPYSLSFDKTVGWQINVFDYGVSAWRFLDTTRIKLWCHDA